MSGTHIGQKILLTLTSHTGLLNIHRPLARDLRNFASLRGTLSSRLTYLKIIKARSKNMKVITSHLTVHQNKSQDSQECQNSQFPQNKTLTMSGIQRIPSMQRSRKIYPIRRKIINQSKLIQILNYREDIKIVIMTLLHKSS